jgi:predicted Zn-dependent peptidase
MLSVATEASVNVRASSSAANWRAPAPSSAPASTATIPRSRSDARVNIFDAAWALFSDAAMHPSFDPADFDRVKTRQLISLKSDSDTPDSALQAQVSKVIYAGHPYANDPNGTIASMQSLTLDDLKRFHREIMQTSRLLLVIVGDLSAESIRQRVDASFGKLPRGDYKPAPVAPLAFTQPTVDVTAKGLPTNYVQGTYAAPGPDSRTSIRFALPMRSCADWFMKKSARSARSRTHPMPSSAARARTRAAST